MPAKKKSARFEKGTTDHDGDGRMGGSKKAAAAKVAKDGVVHDGEGGYMKKGDALPASADIADLKGKGFAE